MPDMTEEQVLAVALESDLRRATQGSYCSHCGANVAMRDHNPWCERPTSQGRVESEAAATHCSNAPGVCPRWPSATHRFEGFRCACGAEIMLPDPLRVPREELIEFVRCIAEGEPFFGSSRIVHGQRAIELAAWEIYRRLQEGGEL